MLTRNILSEECARSRTVERTSPPSPARMRPTDCRVNHAFTAIMLSFRR